MNRPNAKTTASSATARIGGLPTVRVICSDFDTMSLILLII